MVDLWLARLKSIVWPAVLAVLFVAIALLIVLIDAENAPTAGIFGLAAVTMALLAQRA